MKRTRNLNTVSPAQPCRPVDADIYSALLRYVDRYHWSFNTAMRLINLYYGTAYTEKQLKRLYKGAGVDSFPRSAV